MAQKLAPVKDKIKVGDITYGNVLKWSEALKRADIVIGRVVRGVEEGEADYIKQLAKDRGIETKDRTREQVAHEFYLLTKGLWYNKKGEVQK